MDPTEKKRKYEKERKQLEQDDPNLFKKVEQFARKEKERMRAEVSRSSIDPTVLSTNEPISEESPETNWKMMHTTISKGLDRVELTLRNFISETLGMLNTHAENSATIYALAQKYEKTFITLLTWDDTYNPDKLPDLSHLSLELQEQRKNYVHALGLTKESFEKIISNYNATVQSEKVRGLYQYIRTFENRVRELLEYIATMSNNLNASDQHIITKMRQEVENKMHVDISEYDRIFYNNITHTMKYLNDYIATLKTPNPDLGQLSLLYESRILFGTALQSLEAFVTWLIDVTGEIKNIEIIAKNMQPEEFEPIQKKRKEQSQSSETTLPAPQTSIGKSKSSETTLPAPQTSIGKQSKSSDATLPAPVQAVNEPEATKKQPKSASVQYDDQQFKLRVTFFGESRMEAISEMAFESNHVSTVPPGDKFDTYTEKFWDDVSDALLNKFLRGVYVA